MLRIIHPDVPLCVCGHASERHYGRAAHCYTLIPMQDQIATQLRGERAITVCECKGYDPSSSRSEGA